MKTIGLIIICLALCGCYSEGSFTPSVDAASIVSETSVALFYPPCDSSRISSLPTPTATIPDNPPRKLIDGLTIEEYHSFIYHIHLQDSGCFYRPFGAMETKINLDSSYQVSVQPLDMNTEMVSILREDQSIYSAKTFTYGSSGLLQAWGYNDHWVIEIKTELAEYGVDIIYDGESLKKTNRYDNAFGFQVLDNKPFFFFRRSGDWGINYDGHEILLDYEEIPYTNVSIGMDPSILQYQNMVLFQAKRNGERYSVVIGAFH